MLSSCSQHGDEDYVTATQHGDEDYVTATQAARGHDQGINWGEGGGSTDRALHGLKS